MKENERLNDSVPEQAKLRWWNHELLNIIKKKNEEIGKLKAYIDELEHGEKSECDEFSSLKEENEFLKKEIERRDRQTERQKRELTKYQAACIKRKEENKKLRQENRKVYYLREENKGQVKLISILKRENERLKNEKQN